MLPATSWQQRARSINRRRASHRWCCGPDLEEQMMMADVTALSDLPGPRKPWPSDPPPPPTVLFACCCVVQCSSRDSKQIAIEFRSRISKECLGIAFVLLHAWRVQQSAPCIWYGTTRQVLHKYYIGSVGQRILYLDACRACLVHFCTEDLAQRMQMDR
jgi:hypothetical protein